MTTTEIGKIWNENSDWVRYRCKCQLIPLAKKKIIWDIPENAEKPPLSVAEALHILKCIDEQQRGTDVKININKDESYLHNALRYLSNWGYISKIDNYDNLKNVTVTKLDHSFITHNEKPITKSKKYQ